MAKVEGNAVGLKNIGNTCYCNSLLQTYWYVCVRLVLASTPVPVGLELRCPACMCSCVGIWGRLRELANPRTIVSRLQSHKMTATTTPIVVCPPLSLPSSVAVFRIIPLALNAQP